VRVVVREMVDDTGLAGMHVSAAEVLGADDLARGRLHQRRPAEEDRALAADDDRLIAHRGHVGAASGAGSQHRGDLGNAAGAHRGLVEEDPPEMVPVGEDLVLPGQEGAPGVHQVHAGQMVRQGDLLRPQVLLHRHRVVRAALDRGVVGHHDALAAADPADSGDNAGAGRGVLVHALGGQRRDLQERAAGIQQPSHPVPRQELAAGHVPGPGGRGTAQRPHPQAFPQFGDQLLVALARGGRRAQRGHPGQPPSS
jgi:hypothetical protein